MNKIFNVILFAVLLCLNSYFSKAQTPVIAAQIPYTYDVSANGSFTYSVPLRVPPGIKDMVPELAVTYNSQGGNGMLGVGWALSGLSAITRGAPTIYHDGGTSPVDLNADDAYFLDGQRLLGGPTYYQTEVKNFATIESVGTAGNGPSYFTVEYPNGTVYEYGNSISSKMLAVGKPTVFMWAVNKVTDVYGNYIEFEYDATAQAGGEYKIDHIKYGENTNPSSAGIFTKINFNYTTSRYDENETYIKGSEIISKDLLDNIVIEFSNTDQANKYQFTYDSEIQSRLIKIEELRDGTEMLPPIDISWGNPGPQHTIHSGFATLNPKNKVIAGDFNGDGFTDLATTYVNATNDSTKVEVYLNGSGTGLTHSYSQSFNFVVEYINNMISNAEASSRMVLDYNGDGMDDLLLMETNTSGASTYGYNLYVFLGNGTPSVFDYPIHVHSRSNSASNNGNFHNFLRIAINDFDGDGKSEVIALNPFSFQNPTEVDEYELYLIGEEYGSHQIEHTNQLNNVDEMYSLDFNGDGRGELMFTHNNSSNVSVNSVWGLHLSYNSTTLKPQLNQTPTQWPVWVYGSDIYPNKLYKCWYGDFNGDGKSDILTWNSSSPKWSIIYSDGVEPAYSNSAHGPVVVTNNSNSQLSALNQWGPTSSAVSGSYGVYVSDFNGDGLSDILEVEEDASTPYTYNYRLFYSYGSGFYQASSSSPLNVPAHAQVTAVGDFNGDGQADILCANNTSPALVTFRENDNSLKVTSIEHVGRTLSVIYNTLPNDIDYNKVATGNSYFANRTLPLKVVKNLYDNIALSNNYKYEGLMYHKYGLGFRGFTQFRVQNNVGQTTYHDYDLTSNQHPFITQVQVFDPYGGMPYGKLIEYDYLDFDGGAGGKSRIVMSNPAVTYDYINGVKTENNVTTGPTGANTVFYEFGKVASSEVLSKDLNGGNTYGRATITYDYGTNWLLNKGKPISVTNYKEMDPGGANGITTTTNMTYNSTGGVATSVSHPGTPVEKSKSYFYDIYGNLERTELNASGIPYTYVNKYNYSADGRFMIEEIKDADPGGGYNYTTTYDYGDATQLQATWGNLLEKTDVKGQRIEYEYDIVNRVIHTTDYGSPATPYETFTTYDLAANSQYTTSSPDELFAVETSNSVNSSLSVSITDMIGREIRRVTPGPGGNAMEDFTYTIDGKLQTSTTPYFNFSGGPPITTTFSYDAYGREINQLANSPVTGNGPQKQTTYSIVNGLLQTTFTNVGAGQSKTYETCGDYVRRVFNPNFTENINYTYHGNGTKAVTIANGMRFENKLDIYGRLEQVIQPNAGTKEYTYDALDRIEIETLTNGTQYQYTYDNLDRVLTKQEVGTANAYVYQYDNSGLETGELKLEEAPNGNKIEYDYDAAGNVSTIREYNGIHSLGGGPVSTSYHYNADNSVKSIYFMGDSYLEYSYNTYGGLAGVTLHPNNSLGANTRLLWQAMGYEPNGQLQGAYHHDYNGGQLYYEIFSYDEYGHPLTELGVNNSNPSPYIKDMQYDFDIHTSNLNSRMDNLTGNSEDFTYDAYFDRLTGVTLVSGGTPPTTVDMAYDGNNVIGGSLGNISMKTDVAEAPSLPNHPHWKYDGYALSVIPDPNMVSSIPQFTQDVDYYNFQKVKSIEEDQNNRVEYEYGPSDQRTKADYYDISGGGGIINLTKTKYYSSNAEQIIDPISSNDKYNYYVWAEDRLIAILAGSYSMSGGPGGSPATSLAVYHTFTDYLGSITHILNDFGFGGTNGLGLVEERNFDAWGRARDPQTWQAYATGTFPGNWLTDRGYTGQEHLWLGMYDNNVINLNGRIYDPLVGRMFSPDPYIPDETNSQDYNKYTYARNNPLKYTDKDGEWVNIAVGAVLGGYSGYQIGRANGATGGTMIGYIAGGAIVGAATSGIGAGIASTGGAFSSTIGLMASSYFYSAGMNVISGGRTGLGFNFGAGSYDFHSGKAKGIWNWNSLSTGERIGYTLGALANVRDMNLLFNNTNATLYTQRYYDDGSNDYISHSAIEDNDGNTLMSFGPDDNKLSSDAFKGRFVNAKSGNSSTLANVGGYKKFALAFRKSTPDYGVVRDLSVNVNVNKYTMGAVRGFARVLPYHGVSINCVNVASLSLLLNGIPNIGIHPFLLHATVWAYQKGFNASMYSYYLTK